MFMFLWNLIKIINTANPRENDTKNIYHLAIYQKLIENQGQLLGYHKFGDNLVYSNGLTTYAFVINENNYTIRNNIFHIKNKFLSIPFKIKFRYNKDKNLCEFCFNIENIEHEILLEANDLTLKFNGINLINIKHKNQGDTEFKQEEIFIKIDKDNNLYTNNQRMVSPQFSLFNTFTNDLPLDPIKYESIFEENGIYYIWSMEDKKMIIAVPKQNHLMIFEYAVNDKYFVSYYLINHKRLFECNVSYLRTDNIGITINSDIKAVYILNLNEMFNEFIPTFVQANMVQLN